MANPKISDTYQTLYQSALLSANGGLFYMNEIEPFNSFVRTGLTQVLTQRCNVVVDHPSYPYSVTVSYSDPVVTKPQQSNGTKLTPQMAIDLKVHYSSTVRATIMVMVQGKNKEVIHKSSAIIDVAKILVPITSNCCHLSSNNPDSPCNPAKYMEDIIRNYENNIEDLIELEEGIYIIGGSIHTLVHLKDMNTNTLFLNVFQVNTSKTNEPNFVLSGNMLCEAEHTNSVNIVFKMSGTDATKLTMNWSIKAPPFDIIELPFLSLFYIIGIYSESLIVKLVMEHLISDKKEECHALLQMLISNSGMRNVNLRSDFMIALYAVCDETDLIHRLSEISRVPTTKANIYSTFRSRYLTHLNKENSEQEKAKLVSSIIAEMLLEYSNITTIGIAATRDQINKHRQSFGVAQVATAESVSMSRLTKSLYTYSTKPIRAYITKKLEACAWSPQSVNELTADDIGASINIGGITKSMLSAEMERTNIHGKVLQEIHYKMIGANAGKMGRRIKGPAISMFRAYSQELPNMALRESGSDSVGILCPYTTGEGDPCKLRSLTPNAIYSMHEAKKEFIYETIRDKVIRCQHTYCTKLVFESRYIGNICRPMEAIEVICNIRSHNQELRFISMYWDKQLHRLVVKYLKGVPFIPMIRVYSNMLEYLGNNKIKFQSYIKLTDDMIEDMMTGKQTVSNLVEQNVIRYISAHEMGHLYIKASLEDFYATCNDPLEIADYVILGSQTLSIDMAQTPTIHMAAVQRGIFSSSQMKAVGGRQRSNKLRGKKSNTLISTDEPLYINSSTCILDSTTMNILSGFLASPYSQEEGSTVDAHALSRGLGREYIRDDITRVIEGGQLLCELKQLINPPDYLNKDGLPKIGSTLRRGSVVMYIITDMSGKKKMSIMYTHNIPGVCTGTQIVQLAGDRIKVIVSVYMKLSMTNTSKCAHMSGNKSIISYGASPLKLPKMIDGTPITLIFPIAMCVKRNIYDHYISVNSWFTLGSGKQIFYLPFKDIEMVLPEKSYRERIGMSDDGMLKLINSFGYMADFESNIGYIPTRRIEKHGHLEGHATITPRINKTLMQPVKGGKAKNGTFSNAEMSRKLCIQSGASVTDHKMASDTVTHYLCMYCNSQMLYYSIEDQICPNCQSTEGHPVRLAYAFEQFKDRLDASGIGIDLCTYSPCNGGINQSVQQGIAWDNS